MLLVQRLAWNRYTAAHNGIYTTSKPLDINDHASQLEWTFKGCLKLGLCAPDNFLAPNTFSPCKFPLHGIVF